MSQRETLPQNTGHPKRDETSNHWRNSVLVGPQTAGIITAHNEDELSRDSDVMGSDEYMGIPRGGTDQTGGALDYHKSQRK